MGNRADARAETAAFADHTLADHTAYTDHTGADHTDHTGSDHTRADHAVANHALDLMTRVARGDQGAFAHLYDLLAARVLGLVRHILVDHAQSEEVAQEVFLEVWQQAPAFDAQRGSVTAWVMTLAHRRAVDRVRSAQASRTRDEKIGTRDLGVDYDEVAEQVETHVEHERVTRALDRLSGIQRECIVLAYYAGYSQSEISAHLAVPLGTVKTRIRDGMSRLRDELGVTP